ncbi:MAG TPA: hypothetical protein VMA73_06275 [Streptosporangiaceae bacterium]|nr:hypothetical protein [Streptosporangiaceae bacterium]
MQPVTEVADELYALTPADFTAARDERAREARQAGLRDDAAAIKKLARPTTSAWLVNQLSREIPDQLGRLVEVAEALEEAQRTLAGDRLRELSGQRRHVINDLLPQAAAIANRAGQPASAVVMGEVRATLEAALADAAARAAVQSGRLTKPLAYAGLGEVDLTSALALPAGQRTTGSQRTAGGQSKTRGPGNAAKRGRSALAPGTTSGTDVAGTAPSGSSRTEADPAAEAARLAAETMQAAESEADAAARALEIAHRQVAGIAEQQQFLRRRIQHLERELGEANREDAELARAALESETQRDAADRELQAANRRLDQARRAMAKHG